jgi:hypothetical protein
MEAPRPRPRRARTRVRRAALAVLALTALGIVLWLADAFRRREFHLRVYESRIDGALEELRNWPPWDHQPATRSIEANLEAIAALRTPGAMAALERYSRHSSFLRRPDLAWHHHRIYARLAGCYPASTYARGVRDYEDIVGERYFGHKYEEDRSWIDDLAVDAPKAERLRIWRLQHPEHSGQDDVLMRLAACELVRGRGPAAVEILHQALHAPDGDCLPRIVTNIRYTLDRYFDARSLRAWIGSGCPEHLEPMAVYCLAVADFRERRFAAALAGFERLAAQQGPELASLAAWTRSADADEGLELAAEGRSCFAAGGEPEGFAGVLLARVLRQADDCRWFLEKEAELAAASDPRRRAALLHQLGRRCFRAPEAFRSALVREQLGVDYPAGRAASAPRGIEAIPRDCGYRQAAECFQEISARFPDYEKLDEVDYSIPLCLWRWKHEASRRGTWTGADFDLDIAEAFQAFADKHPRSSMADEALYQAGVHFQLQGATAMMEANMETIARDHPGGDLIRSDARRNGFLREALREAGVATAAFECEEEELWYSEIEFAHARADAEDTAAGAGADDAAPVEAAETGVDSEGAF